ncbi:MAG: bifunctional molybdenum cofactor biosynthesis protein MoaC/MoaB [Bacteroidetes bacterium]|nr:bifunctional molybdenum cofactor biosynthesis protein MoaC/MoaB [Bacteroidota bacterium]
MVDITHKTFSLRNAVAEATVNVSLLSTIEAIQQNRVPKGNIFEFSRAAGLLAAKKTYEVIPDCHPLPVEQASIKHELSGQSILIRVEVSTIYKTGVEVEAMHAAAVTALTIYDMLKPIDPKVEIAGIRLLEKTGGKTDFVASYPDDLKIALVTVSNKVVAGEVDKPGDIIEGKLKKLNLTSIERLVIGEQKIEIEKTCRNLIAKSYDLILLTGGSGLQLMDVTPDVVQRLIDREVPGIMEAVRDYGRLRRPQALLGRGVAGFSGETLLITLPGSPKGAKESMDAVFPTILHVFRSKKS